MTSRLALLWVVLFWSAVAHGQQWFFNWDGTTDITCVPTVEGNNAFYPGAAANSAFHWEIADNGGGGKAFRQVVTGDSGFRWYGYGSRPEYYRGPCTTLAMENLRADRNAFTIAYRIKAESCSSTSKTRFFNCEFETTELSPWWHGQPEEFAQTGGSYGPYLGFRVEFSLRKDASGDIWLADHRTDQNIYKLKTSSGQPTWHTVWATCELPVHPYATPYSRYRIWIDGTEVAWDDRDRCGWSDVEVGWTPSSGKYATFALDYVCYTYGAYPPGSIPIPPERAAASTNSIATLKSYADGTPCELTNKIVMGVFTDVRLGTKVYYLCELDGADGIKVTHNTGKSPHNTGGSAVTLAIGNVVSVKGGLNSAEAEKQISAHDITYLSAGTSPAMPLSVSNAALTNSCNAALYANSPRQLLATAETGIIGSLTATTITDTGKSWTADQWQNMTVFLPATARHPSLYYHVIANTSDTLTLSHRAIRSDFNSQPNLTVDGVAAGDAYEFSGGRPAGPRLDGRLVRTTGIVTAVDPAAGYFDINDGGGSGDTQTLQDIWDTIHYGWAFVPPNGIRVYTVSPLPGLGDTAAAVGCLGMSRFKHQASTIVDPNNSARDETKVDKVMPVVWGQSWVAGRITTQPLSQSACRGGSVTFTVAATGSGTMSYQWQKNGFDLSNGGQYSGATASTLTISNVDDADVADYRCVITADYGSMASEIALLTLKQTVATDLDHDCDVDAADILDFTACISGAEAACAAECAKADFDLDGDVDQSDFGRLQRCLSGAHVSADPNCMN